MATPEELDAEAAVLEAGAVKFEEQKLPVAAQVKVQQAKSKRDQAALRRQQIGRATDMVDEVQQVEAELKKASAEIEDLKAQLASLPADAPAAREEYLQQSILILRREKELLLQRLPPIKGGGSLDAVLTAIQELKARVAERHSRTRQASEIKEAELEQVTRSLKCCVVWAEDDPPLESLLGPQPDEDTAACWDEDLTEPAQRDECAKKLRQHIPFRQGPGAFDLRDVKNRTVDLTCEGLPYPVSGRNDELVSLRRYRNDYLHGGVLGVELKKKLTWASIRQAETEYLLFANKSWLPFCQVATDFATGGIALFHSELTGDQRLITGRVFEGMPSFWRFFTDYLQNIPEGLGGSGGSPFAEELPNPKRLRFQIGGPSQSGDEDAAQRVRAALRKLASMYNNWGDVANLADLQGFHELGTDTAIPPYFV